MGGGNAQFHTVSMDVSSLEAKAFFEFVRGRYMSFHSILMANQYSERVV